MCKTKEQILPSVWGRTDYVAYRFDYFSIGHAKDEVAELIQSHFPRSKFISHKMKDEDREMVSIDNMAYNLSLSLDEVNNETVYHFLCQDKEKKHDYEIYIGRYFTQLIYRKKAVSTDDQPDFKDLAFLLDYFLKTDRLNIEKMTCIVHTIVEDSLESISRIAEPVVLAELIDNNVFQSTYTDTRDSKEFRLESKRAVNRSMDEQFKLEVTGVSYYPILTVTRFLNAFVPLMKVALLENTRYFIA